MSIDEMINLPGGLFWIGSPETEKGRFNDEPRTQVQLSPYSIGRYPVTQEEWEQVMGSNPRNGELNGILPIGPRLPVQDVSWFDALCYCNARSLREGLRPAYYFKGKDEPPDAGNHSVPLQREHSAHLDDSDDITWDRSANGYRLPTEAEWEVAARGGEQTIYAGSDDPNEVAWYKNNAHAPQPVGGKAPNAYGLYDMSGNVWEWCWDWYAAAYVGGTDPIGPYQGSLRVLRGGSWNYDASCLRVAGRDYIGPTARVRNLGFRLARSI